MGWVFSVLEGMHQGATRVFAEGRSVTVGHSATCDVVLLDESLAEVAFEVQFGAECMQLIARTEGVYVGGRRISKNAKTTIKRDGIVVVGVVKCRFMRTFEAWESRWCRFIKYMKRLLKLSVLTFFGGVSAIACVLVVVWSLLPPIENVEQTLEEMRQRAAGAPEQIASYYGLELIEDETGYCLRGNVATPILRDEIRRKIAQTAPDVCVEITDDMTLQNSIAAILQLMGEDKITITTVTNCVVELAGEAHSKQQLADTVAMIRADLPMIRQIEVKTTYPKENLICVSHSPKQDKSEPQKQYDVPHLGVIAILQTPYPCVLLEDGTRCVEGAIVKGWMFVAIDTDGICLEKEGVSIRWTP